MAELLVRATVRDAAKAAHLSERQAYRLLGDAGFRRELDEGRALAFGSAMRRLSTLTSNAVDALHDLLQGGAADPQTRARVALGVLQAASRYEEQADLLRRVEELERRAHAKAGDHPRSGGRWA
jgi:hypothetical protein